MPSNIPGARAILESVLDEADPSLSGRIRSALDLMRRDPRAKPRAPMTSRKVDAQVAQDIRQYVEANPFMSIVEVATVFDTNPGRVSEAIHYLR